MACSVPARRCQRGLPDGRLVTAREKRRCDQHEYSQGRIPTQPLAIYSVLHGRRSATDIAAKTLSRMGQVLDQRFSKQMTHGKTRGTSIFNLDKKSSLAQLICGPTKGNGVRHVKGLLARTNWSLEKRIPRETARNTKDGQRL